MSDLIARFVGAKGFAWPLLVTCLVLLSSLVLAGAPLPGFDRVMVLPEPREITDAELTSHKGESFRLTQLRGRPSLIFFGFTNCADVCPAAMAKFLQLERSGLLDSHAVNFALISVDGERDSPEAMRVFLRQFSEAFVGLTGDPGDVRKIATSFRAPFFKGDMRGADGSYSVAHSTQMFLLDRAGRLRAELHNPTVEAMAGITNAVLAETDP